MWLKYLIEAIKNKDEQLILEITKIVAAQAFNEIETNGSTALHWLAWSGNKQATQMLIDAKPEIMKLLDNDGFSALHYAALNGSVETMNILLKSKPELLDMVTNGSSTALKAAYIIGPWEAIMLLQYYKNAIKNEKIEQPETQLTQYIYSNQHDFLDDIKVELIAFESINENS